MRKLYHIILSIVFIFTFAACDALPTKPSITPEVTPTSHTETEIIFSEPAIEAKIREILSKPEGALTKADLSQVTEFSLMENMESIQDLQWLTNLEELHLEVYGLTDLIPLQSLKKLKVLRISDCPLEDISLLQCLPQLEVLWLTKCQVKDVTALQHLTNLKELNLTYTLVTDLTKLQGLTVLESLSVRYCPVDSIEFLKNMNHLKELDLYDTAVTDIEALKALPSLQKVTLSDPITQEQVQQLNVALPNCQVTWVA